MPYFIKSGGWLAQRNGKPGELDLDWLIRTISPGGSLTLTTLGTSGPATLTAGVLNIPQYSSGGGGGGTWGTITGTLSNQTDLQTVLNAKVTLNGVGGTPSSLTLTNATGLPAASIIAGALANGMTATTQSTGDNSTKVATTAYVDAITLSIGTGLTNTGGVLSSDLSTGKSSTQSVVGGVSSGGSLTLSSTSHATKGNINFGSGGSLYNEANNTVTWALATQGSSMTSTWTATGNNQFMMNFTGTATSENVNNDTIYGYQFAPNFVKNAGAPSGQSAYGVFIKQPTISGGAFLSTGSMLIQGGATNALAALQIGNSAFTGTLAIYQTTTSTFVIESGSSILMSATNLIGAGVGGSFNSSTTILGFPELRGKQNNTGNSLVLTGNFAGSGAGQTGSGVAIGGTVNTQTTGISKSLSFDATIINLNANATNVVHYGIHYNPTLTNVTGLGTHYGVVIQPTATLSGFGMSAPTSTLQTGGSFALAYISKATSYTATSVDGVIEVTATGQTITLPTAVGCQGRIYTIKLTASGSSTVATTSSQNIDASTTYSLSAQYKYVTVQSNNVGWIIISNN